MTRPRRGRRFARAALVALAALAVLAASGGSSLAAADSTAARSPATSARSTTGATTGATGCGDPAAEGLARRAGDTRSYSTARLRRIDRQLQRHLGASGFTRATGRFGLVLRIPVRAHVIAGNKDSGSSRAEVLKQLSVLNKAYAGGQSASSAQSRFTFYLASYDRVVNQRWHTASIGDPIAARYRTILHRGGPNDLNLYVAAPVSIEQGTVLGWSTPPWQAARHLKADGVTIHEDSMPGGALTDYNEGDTAVHEVGHWFGLLHTFEGGCSAAGDLVDDTPAELDPSQGCDTAKDTCAATGLDPVHNFMDYAPDACMDMFTPGQVSRMTANWLAYRTP